jgi:hypothetical protein
MFRVVCIRCKSEGLWLSKRENKKVNNGDWRVKGLHMKHIRSVARNMKRWKLTLRLPSWVNCLPQSSRRHRYGLA